MCAIAKKGGRQKVCTTTVQKSEDCLYAFYALRTLP